MSAEHLPPYLRVPHLAELLGITPNGVRAMLRRAELPAALVGKRYLVRREAFVAYVERRERERRAPTPAERDPARLLRGLAPPRRSRLDAPAP